VQFATEIAGAGHGTGHGRSVAVDAVGSICEDSLHLLLAKCLNSYAAFGRPNFGDVAGQHIGDEFLDVEEDGAPLLDGPHDGRKVVVHQHQVRRLFRHLGTGYAHRHAHIGVVQSRCIVHVIAPFFCKPLTI
jgi:hypothetical protein